MRPHQWTKNLFVLAPVLFEHRFEMPKNLRALSAFGIFCLLSSAIYLLNDVVDREADRQHPRKSRRPIASGEVPVGLALALAVALAGGALAWSWAGLHSKGVVAVAVAYLAIQSAYSLVLKRMVVVDVLCISSGFVLRMIAGSSAAFVVQSAWILVCTIFVSLFLALCKRRHEVMSLGDGAAGHRATLADYPPALLDQLISAATSATLVTYALYTVDQKTLEMHGFLFNGRPVPVLAATIPFVIYGVFRYLFLVYRRDQGGSPTVTLLRDVPSLVNGVLYLGTVVALFLKFGPSSRT
jgi:4-hydroxybenzoate polyprenyltransferase